MTAALRWVSLTLNPSYKSHLPTQLPQHPVQLIQIAVLDMQRAALAAVIDGHFQSQGVRQPPLERARVSVLGAAGVALGLSAQVARLRAAVLAHLSLIPIDA